MVTYRQEEKLYYWIVGISDTSGRRIIYGCKESYEEAQKTEAGILNAECEIIPLKTKDSRRAAQMIRARVLNETQSIDETLKRFKHME